MVAEMGSMWSVNLGLEGMPRLDFVDVGVFIDFVGRPLGETDEHVDVEDIEIRDREDDDDDGD